MGEAQLITLSFKELAEILVKKQDIHEGFWGIYVKFGIRAINAGQTEEDLRPTAIVPIQEVGLQKFDELNNLSVDAATVNPKLGGKKSTKKK